MLDAGLLLHRQPFLVAYAIAAVAMDAVDSVPPCTGSTADVQRPKCNIAIELIDKDILALMQSSSLYTFATMYHDTMLRYVFLRRALQGRASIDEVWPFLYMQL